MLLAVCLRAPWARRESNPRPGPYKRPALTTELRASGAEGSRTLTFPLKRRKRCRYATTPSVEWAYAFESCGLRHVISPLFSCPRWSRTTAGDVSDRYASVTTPDSREGGSRTRGLVLPRHARHRSSSSRLSFLRCSDPCGIRTQPLQLERLTTSPEVERAVLLLSAYAERSGSGGARILVCGFSGHR